MEQKRKRHEEPEPRIAVFCRCGAAWFGRFAVSNPVIADHQERLGCGPPITADEYEQGTYSPNHLARPIKWPPDWTEEERKAAREAPGAP